MYVRSLLGVLFDNKYSSNQNFSLQDRFDISSTIVVQTRARSWHSERKIYNFNQPICANWFAKYCQNPSEIRTWVMCRHVIQMHVYDIALANKRLCMSVIKTDFFAAVGDIIFVHWSVLMTEQHHESRARMIWSVIRYWINYPMAIPRCIWTSHSKQLDIYPCIWHLRKWYISPDAILMLNDKSFQQFAPSSWIGIVNKCV